MASDETEFLTNVVRICSSCILWQLNTV